MHTKLVSLEIPESSNIIVGHSHFIKTAEDLYEILVGSSPGAKFGIAFCEASGPCLIRVEGNNADLQEAAVRNAKSLASGHTFVILLREAYPINVLNAIKACQEVCRIHCATANPTQIVVAESEQGCGILGVIDGSSPKGVEGEADQKARRELLRKFGYKKYG